MYLLLGCVIPGKYSFFFPFFFNFQFLNFNQSQYLYKYWDWLKFKNWKLKKKGKKKEYFPGMTHPNSKYIYDIAHFSRIAFTGNQTLKKQEAKYSKTRYVWSALLFLLHFRVFLTSNSNKKLSFLQQRIFFICAKRKKKSSFSS